ncbi:unnamed protein product [Symbiodinium necroappetens]|uniref:Uncharacterized protein n=1 Tax=Symbiodinium necroappetens TaxID=1628268 RepID=A0A812P753_9DINO|nr:unnamed protein product [Symbiodinium necroappetens]
MPLTRQTRRPGDGARRDLTRSSGRKRRSGGTASCSRRSTAVPSRQWQAQRRRPQALH